MKKTKSILKVFIIGIILGIITSFLVYHPIGNYLTNSVGSIKWYVHILLIILFFILNIAVHELGHFIMAKSKGLKVKALYIFIFVFYLNEDNKIKFKISPKLAILLGGLLMIEPPLIRNDDEFNEYIENTKSSTIAGPITSVIFGISVVIITLILLFVQNLVLSGLMINVSLVTILMTLLVYKSSNLSYKGLYGDFVLNRKLDKDEIIKTALIVNNYKNTNYNEYMINLLTKTLVNNQHAVNNSFYQSLLITYIELVLDDPNNYNSELNHILSIKPFKIRRDESGYILANYLYLHYIQTQNEEYSSLYNDLLNNNNFSISAKTKEFWSLYTKALIGADLDMLNKLSNKKAYYPNSTSWIINIIFDQNDLIYKFRLIEPEV